MVMDQCRQFFVKAPSPAKLPVPELRHLPALQGAEMRDGRRRIVAGYLTQYILMMDIKEFRNRQEIIETG